MGFITNSWVILVNKTESECGHGCVDIPMLAFPNFSRFYYLEKYDVSDGKIVDKLYIDISRVSRLVVGGRRTKMEPVDIPVDFVYRGLLEVCSRVEQEMKS